MVSKREPPIGSRWRILANGPRGMRFSLYSYDYTDVDVTKVEGPTVFDELVIDGWLHIGQLDRNRWWIRLGDEHREIVIGRDGKVTVGEMYK